MLSVSSIGASEIHGKDVAKALWSFPLINVRDLARIRHEDVKKLYREIWILQSKKLVEPVRLGRTRGRSIRFYLTGEGLASINEEGTSWHEPGQLCALLDRFPLVEWFYDVAGTYEGMGRLEKYQWIDGLGFDAAVLYERGWAALFWSGPLQNDSVLDARLHNFSEDLRKLNRLGEDLTWPGLFCFVVSDEWQRELVLRAVEYNRFENQTQIWCVSDGSFYGVTEPRPSRGWVYQPLVHRRLGSWPWAKRVESSLWADPGAVSLGRVLDSVLEWPGISTKVSGKMLGDVQNNRLFEPFSRQLLKDGFIGRSRSSDGYRYHLMPKGLDRAVRLDRVKYADYERRAQASSWVKMPSRREHEDGVMSVMGEFRVKGAPVASGWRCWEHLGGSGGIAPDGLVYLKESPYGPGWHYVEYERRARGVFKVKGKLKGYASRRRRNRWPVLMVCWDEVAEGVFHEVGIEWNVNMLTTTIGRLEEFGPLGNGDCWSKYGEPVVLE